MTITPSTLLSLPLITTGTESGDWGNDVNNGLTSYLDIAIAGTLSLTSASFTANALTLANTAGTSSATNIGTTTAQYMVLKVSSLAANVTITAPSTSKMYLVDNTDATYTVTIKASGQSGYTVAVSTRALVYYNGTDYVLATSNNRNSLINTLSIANGGTNATTTPTAGAVAYGTGTAYAFTSAGSAGQVLQSNGASAPTWANAATGTVTSVSWTGGIVSVANGTTTPAFTIAGTSGGIPYFSSASTWATSAALAANALVIGGGAGAAPSTTTTGTGVVTAVGNAVNTTGGLVTQSGTLAASAVLIGGGSGTAISSTTTGTGVVTALGNNANATGGFTTVDGTATLTNKTLTNPTVTNYTETLYTANTGTAITVSLANGTVQKLTLTGNATITMPTAAAGKSFIIMLKQDGTGSRTVTWSTVTWPGGTAPTITSTANKQDIFSFFSDGTSWFGVTVGQNY